MTEAGTPIDLDVPGGPAAGRSRRRQRGYWAGATVLLVAAVAIAIVGIGPARDPHRPPPITGPLGWIDALVDGPARGGLAGDRAFARDLPARITAMLQQTGSYPEDLFGIHHSWNPDQEVRLLFADDIDTRRIVLLALRLPMAQAPIDRSDDQYASPRTYIAGNRTKVLWFAAPRGASVASLLSHFTASPDPGVSVGSMPATPFILVHATDDFADTTVGVAPPGCTVSTARTTDLDRFVDEPTGSYIVRTAASSRAEYWRVTCAGTVHEQWPTPASFRDPSPEEIRAALAADAGLSPAEAATAEVHAAAAGALATLDSRSTELTAAPRVLWAGAPQVDPELAQVQRPYAVVVAAPAVRSGWFVGVWFGYLVDGYGAGLGSALIHTDTDPAQGAVLAAPLRLPDKSGVLVLAPPRADRVRLATSAGTVVRETPLTGAAAVLALPTEPADLRIQAYDTTGTLVAAPVPVSPYQGAPDEIRDWGGRPTIAD